MTEPKSAANVYNKETCGVFSDGKCIMAAGIVGYDNGRFEVMQNGFSIYKGRNKARAFTVYNSLNLSLQQMAKNSGMMFHE